MKYEIYFTRSNSDDNHETKVTTLYNDTPYKSLKAVKAALKGVKDLLNDECYTITYENSLTLVGERTDNKPQPTTDRIVFSICLSEREL
mgnify:CR=1 FL=1|jgi:hypothetical protein